VVVAAQPGNTTWDHSLGPQPGTTTCTLHATQCTAHAVPPHRRTALPHASWQEVMAVLRKLYGASVPNPVDYKITRWAADPLAYGSYSYTAKGSDYAADHRK
jgi:hypothetical protein